MATDYEVEWLPQALKELRRIDSAIRLQLLRKLDERRRNPRVPGDVLHGLKDCYKIKPARPATGWYTGSKTRGWW